MSEKKIQVYFPAQYPIGTSPSQRFRIEQYFSYLLNENITFNIEPFITEYFYPIFFKKGFLIKKTLGTLNGFLRRCWSLRKIHKYDYVFIQREASPIGPPIFEWLYTKVFRAKVIYDFDDAIWIPRISESNRMAIHFKCFWKIKHIIKWSHQVIVGNSYLFQYANQFNKGVVIIPTSVDTVKKFNLLANQDVQKVSVVWTGSFSTNQYVEALSPVLNQLQKTVPFHFVVISNKRPNIHLQDMEFVEWSELNEVSTLAQCQIGIMPMSKDEWSKGKCGFKLIQYMSLGIVPVADNWGANADIIENNLSGILIQSADEWIEKLKILIQDTAQRKLISHHAQLRAKASFSLDNNFSLLFPLFRDTILP